MASSKLVVLLVACVAVCLVAPASAFFFRSYNPNERASGSGSTCAICTVMMGLVDQLAVVHHESNTAAFKRLCAAYPQPYSRLCNTFRLRYGFKLVRQLDKGDTPDVACMGSEFCAPSQCHLYPLKSREDLAPAHIAELIAMPGPSAKQDIETKGVCSIPFMGTVICNMLNLQAFSIQYPKDDKDKDAFSKSNILRGADWRGKDCGEGNAAIYPGRKPNQGDNFVDSNCNGIKGFDAESQMTWEEKLCGDSQAKGVIALGDSVTANFHVPAEWFNATILSKEWLENMTYLMDNSMNWPHTSLYTGSVNVSWPIVDGHTDSLYLRMRERNLCNHRDYQNIGFNGARTTDSAKLTESLKRSPVQDKPGLVMYSYVGNDVCKYHVNPALSDVTTPAQAVKGLLDTMALLNTKMAPLSHVIVVAIADARILYEGLIDRIHPFGATMEDVTFNDFYNWLECLDISPCPGWLTNNATVREGTAQVVRDINAALENFVNENPNRFSNFEMIFVPNPVDEVVAAHVAQGGEPWELVELFDGFHPNQKAHALVAEVVWEKLVQEHPHVLGPVNPNNHRIRQMFGDQGGH
ncbi:hypothetical protein RvY_10148 [Ramazzottius varieornatus]|uniref:Saposin B-type domain-containing protein n=1 Tax=Ramazzottius varieornatus TaxID=947166 RepID=A0A1D1VBU4_RAMVA|nr:hypothetical protein RvY_10148 [Ramazzottius varieornatus]